VFDVLVVLDLELAEVELVVELVVVVAVRDFSTLTVGEAVDATFTAVAFTVFTVAAATVNCVVALVTAATFVDVT
jgi:hypothetical protein